MTAHYEDGPVQVWHGDCIDVMRGMPDNSVDAVVTDPPYGLEFMGREWDSFGPQRDARTAGRAGDGAITAGAGTGTTDGRWTDETGRSIPSGRVSFGNTKPSTWRCDTCGKRDQFRNHAAAAPDCTGTWIREPIYAGAPKQMLAFQAWCEEWATEAMRLLKPGGHLLAFGGTRTHHRLASGIEDAGFEIRDSIAWLYGSGFPKSLDVGKAIDKQLGAEGTYGAPKSAAHAGWVDRGRMRGTEGHEGYQRPWMQDEEAVDRAARKYEPGSADAARWNGWGTAMKPAHEPVVVARKPLEGTVAQTVLTFGTGALNIDGSRIGTEERTYGPSAAPGGNAVRLTGGDGRDAENARAYAAASKEREPITVQGRWPANVVIDASQAAALDTQSGTLTSGVVGNSVRHHSDNAAVSYANVAPAGTPLTGYGDTGGASRFFKTVDTVAPRFMYTAKAGSDERPGVDGVSHPTVKPVDLMRWLVKLVTPPGGIVLEPFAGSGTTVEACVLEGFRCIAIEREADYLPLILKRIRKPHAVGLDLGDWDDTPAPVHQPEPVKVRRGDPGMFFLDGCRTADELRALAEQGAKTPKGRDARTTLARYDAANERATAARVEAAPADVGGFDFGEWEA